MADIETTDGKFFQLVDADTISDGDQRYRIEGYNAKETEKIIEDKDKGLIFKQGQVGGREQTDAVRRIVQAGGFNVIEDLGRTDSFGRKRIRIKNEFGDDLTNTLYQAGVIDMNQFTDEEGIQAIQAGRLSKELRGKRLYEDIVQEEMSAVKSKPVLFKDSAINENEYAQSVKEVVADQMGLDLTNEDDHRKAINIVQSGKYDARSIPFSGIDFRKSDRTEEGVAYNQMTSAWNTGWQGMATGLAGFAELMGVQLGSDTLKKYGESKVRLAKEDLAEMPALKGVDYRDVDSLMDAWYFMSNNLAMSAPYLVTLTAGSLLAPFTGGLSAGIAYGSHGATFAGQVWNDIKGPKGRAEATGAIMAGTAMAMLDRLGLKAIMKPSDMLTTEGRKKVIQALANQRNITPEAAKVLMAKEGKKVIKETIEGMGNFASDNINNSGILRDLLRRAGVGGAAESITEASQEGIGYLSSMGMSQGGLKENFNPNEFTNLLISSAVAGGTLGSGFSTAGGLIAAGDAYATKRGLETGRIGELGRTDRVAQELGPQGAIRNLVDDLNKDTVNIKPTSDSSVTSDRAQSGKIERGGFLNKFKNPSRFFPELYRSSSLTAFSADKLRRSESVRKLAALVGTVAGKMYSGRDVQSQEAYLRSNLIDTINPKRVFKRFGMRDSVTNSQKISDMIRRYTAGDTTNMTPSDINAIEQTIAELKAFSDLEYKIRNDTYKSQGKDRVDLARDKDEWLNRQAWDWQKVRQNRKEFYEFMRKNGKMTEAEIDVLYSKLSNNEDATDFSTVEGIEYIPGNNKDGIDLWSKKGYSKFANTNILQNAINTANQTAKYSAYTEYFGAGGKNIDYLLSKMENEGLTKEEVDEIAFHTKNIIDAGTGNFNRIKNRKLAAFQQTAAFYAAMVGLPLSAISSFPEFAMILYQGRGGKDVQNGILAGVKEVKEIFKSIAQMKINNKIGYPPHANIDKESFQRLTKSGLFNDDAAIATRLGLGETDVTKAWWQKQFFKYSGIAGVTQLQRAIAASAVSGFVGDRIRILAAKPADVEFNQDQLEVYRQLANMGLDVEGMIEVYNRYNNPVIFDTFSDATDSMSDADYEFVDQQMNIGTWNFVNDRVQNPQAFNRPLFFQDPHYQLFVQFNGFISTFTANIVPKLYNDYLKNGSPRMQYNTFAMMVTMMAIAGGSQWLKDFIKFGGSTPYLSDAQLLQRALQSSGLLGTGERLLQGALPLYRSRDESITDRLFGETVGGSPTVRSIGTAMKAIGALGKGETERAASHATKLIPGVGPITPVRNIITDLVHGKSPDPYPFLEKGE